MIDLSKFIDKKTVNVPIIDGRFKYNRKIYSIPEPCEDGWYAVELEGNSANLRQAVFPESIPEFNKDHTILKGYTYNNIMVFQNFDVGKRKSGVEVMADLNFNTMPTFMSIEAILWEDKKLYYYRPNYMDTIIFSIKSAYDNNDNNVKELKGITPELKTLYLFHDLERQRMIMEQERLRKEQEIEEFKKTLQGRLLLTFNRVGAEIIDYSVTGNRITVNWKLPSGRAFNSVVNSDDFRVIEAGYCMSGDDKRHSATSMVELAKDYEDDNLIHHTRTR